MVMCSIWKKHKVPIKSIFGIIPVRGGSKRLPGKNMKVLGGMNLLERTLRQAKEVFSVSVVSTDNEKMALEAMRCGAKALWRPSRLAQDDTPTSYVIEQVIFTYPDFEWFCLLQVTSPLRSINDIMNCIALAEATDKPVISTLNGVTNGAVYIGKTSSFADDFFKDAVHYEMPESRSIDINTLEDFRKAEKLLEKHGEI